MTHWKKPFKSDYLASCDIEGTDLNLTITHVTQEMCKLSTGDQLCNLAHFKESGFKPMILNVTNSKVVMKFARNSPNIEDWKNIPISVYVDQKVRLGRDIVEGLRIRPIQPRPAGTTQTKIVLTSDSPNWKQIVDWLKAGNKIEAVIAKYDISEADLGKLKKEIQDEPAEQV